MQRARIFTTVSRYFVLCAMVCCGLCATVHANVSDDTIAQSMAHYTMGLIHDMYGATEAAIEEYHKAASLDERNYLIHLRLGADYANLGELPRAIEALNLAKKYNPDDLQAGYLLALIYSTQKDFDKAAGEYESLLRHFSDSDPENADAYRYLGQLYYSQKKFDKAIEQFEHILAFEPKNADILSVLGSLHIEVDDRERAVELFKQALAIDPDHEVSLNALGYLYAEQNINLDEAQQLIERVLALDPDNGAYLDSMGWVYFKKDMPYKALEYLTKASMAFQDPVIYEHIGDVYHALNENENARKYWQRSLDLLADQDHVIEKMNKLDGN